jgi:hypothetical protein
VEMLKAENTKLAQNTTAEVTPQARSH